jgi:hypothetical protein
MTTARLCPTSLSCPVAPLNTYTFLKDLDDLHVSEPLMNHRWPMRPPKSTSSAARVALAATARLQAPLRAAAGVATTVTAVTAITVAVAVAQ